MKLKLTVCSEKTFTIFVNVTVSKRILKFGSFVRLGGLNIFHPPNDQSNTNVTLAYSTYVDKI